VTPAWHSQPVPATRGRGRARRHGRRQRLGREGAAEATTREPFGDGECVEHGSQRRDSPRWRRRSEVAEFRECGDISAVVALWSSSTVSSGVLQIVEMKGSEIGLKEEGGEG
jgi:hypothetical protein